MNTSITLKDLSDACNTLSAAPPNTLKGFVDRGTGAVHWVSESLPGEADQLGVQDSGRFVELPSKAELDLGRELALRFVEFHLPDEYERARGFFLSADAYKRFKGLLDHHALLETWFAYETSETETALAEWAQNNDLPLADDSANA